MKKKTISLGDALFFCYFGLISAAMAVITWLDFRGKFSLPIVAAAVACSVPISYLILYFVKRLPEASAREKSGQTYRKLAVWAFVGNAAVFCILYGAFYPGGFSVDSINQLGQALSGTYSDWHPYIHTLLSFTLPLKLTGTAAAIVPFQFLCIAAVLTYMDVSIYRYFGMRTVILSNLYIVLNPFVLFVCIFPWKDVLFALAGLMVAIYQLHIYMSGGKWLRRPGNWISLGLALALTLLLRHNGVLFTFFALLSICFFCDRHDVIKVCLIVCSLVFIVKIPLMQALEVEKPDKRLSETVGLPLTIMANVARNQPDDLSEETSTFLNALSSEEVYAKYVPGSFNSIKWSPETHIEEVDKRSLRDILRMTGECIIKHPAESMEAALRLTELVYACGPDSVTYARAYWIASNDYGIEEHCIRSLHNALIGYRDVIGISVFGILTRIGTSILIMLAFVLGRSDLTSGNDWKRILLCIPIFAYDFGTMLLLTGADVRFFLISYFVCPIVVCIMLANNKNKEGMRK